MGCLSFETIFSSLSCPRPLWRWLFIFEIQLFSMLFDLRFAPNALSTEVWKSHPVPQQWDGQMLLSLASSVHYDALSLQTQLKFFSITHRPALIKTIKVQNMRTFWVQAPGRPKMVLFFFVMVLICSDTIPPVFTLCQFNQSLSLPL